MGLSYRVPKPTLENDINPVSKVHLQEVDSSSYKTVLRTNAMKGILILSHDFQSTSFTRTYLTVKTKWQKVAEYTDHDVYKVTFPTKITPFIFKYITHHILLESGFSHHRSSDDDFLVNVETNPGPTRRILSIVRQLARIRFEVEDFILDGQDYIILPFGAERLPYLAFKDLLLCEGEDGLFAAVEQISFERKEKICEIFIDYCVEQGIDYWYSSDNVNYPNEPYVRSFLMDDNFLVNVETNPGPPKPNQNTRTVKVVAKIPPENKKPGFSKEVSGDDGKIRDKLPTSLNTPLRPFKSPKGQTGTVMNLRDPSPLSGTTQSTQKPYSKDGHTTRKPKVKNIYKKPPQAFQAPITESLNELKTKPIDQEKTREPDVEDEPLMNSAEAAKFRLDAENSRQRNLLVLKQRDARSSLFGILAPKLFDFRESADNALKTYHNTFLFKKYTQLLDREVQNEIIKKLYPEKLLKSCKDKIVTTKDVCSMFSMPRKQREKFRDLKMTPMAELMLHWINPPIVESIEDRIRSLEKKMKDAGMIYSGASKPLPEPKKIHTNEKKKSAYWVQNEEDSLSWPIYSSTSVSIEPEEEISADLSITDDFGTKPRLVEPVARGFEELLEVPKFPFMDIFTVPMLSGLKYEPISSPSRFYSLRQTEVSELTMEARRLAMISRKDLYLRDGCEHIPDKLLYNFLSCLEPSSSDNDKFDYDVSETILNGLYRTNRDPPPGDGGGSLFPYLFPKGFYELSYSKSKNIINKSAPSMTLGSERASMVMSEDSFDLTMREGFDSISGPLSNSFCSYFEGTMFDYYNIAEHRAKYASRQMVTAVLREKTSLNICGFLKALYKIKSLIGSFTVCQQYVDHMALSGFESHVLPSNTVDYVERRLSKLFPDARATSFKRLGVIPFILTKREYQIRFILHDDKHNVESDHMIFPEDLAEYSKLERFNKYGLIGPNSVIRTNLTWGGEICPATRVLHPNSISRQYLGGNTSVRLEQSIVIYEEYWNIVNQLLFYLDPYKRLFQPPHLA
jgi:hypothetical protein